MLLIALPKSAGKELLPDAEALGEGVTLSEAEPDEEFPWAVRPGRGGRLRVTVVRVEDKDSLLRTLRERGLDVAEFSLAPVLVKMGTGVVVEAHVIVHRTGSETS